MGLDLVELTIRIEDAFGITIPDEVAATLTTPREVTEYVLTQLKLGNQSACMTQQAFYRLRKEFVPVLGIERLDFHPSANLAQLIATEDRITTWNTIRSSIGPKALPDLIRPLWMYLLLSMATVATAIVAFHYRRLASDSGVLATVVSGLMLIGLGEGAELATRPFKRHFRRQYAHAGELANYFVLHSPHSFKKEWTEEEVAALVRQIIIDDTGVTDFTDDSRFVQDMNLD
jgi:hypothetical protein